MLLVVTLFIPLVFSLLVYLSGNKLAKYVALIGGVAGLIACILMKPAFISSCLTPLVYTRIDWIAKPHHPFFADGGRA